MAHKIDEVSSLSETEFARIVASILWTWSDKDNSDSDLSSRGYSDAAIQEMRKKSQKNFTPIKCLGLKFTRPLNNFKTDFIHYPWTLFENYERGLLPFPGSVSDQPAQIMEIFGVFKALKVEHEKIQNKKHAAEQARRAKVGKR